jgi:sugar (pentulose or hexulose) kinase
MGNILVQAMATGDIKNLSEARKVVRESFAVKRYEPRDSKPWDKAYQRFVNLIQK